MLLPDDIYMFPHRCHLKSAGTVSVSTDTLGENSTGFLPGES